MQATCTLSVEQPFGKDLYKFPQNLVEDYLTMYIVVRMLLLSSILFLTWCV